MPRQNAGRSMSLTSQESYSAVIIADMIAEVPTAPENMDVEKGRKNSAKIENGVDATGKKVEVNLGYDDQTDLTPPAVVNVDTMDTVNVNSNRVNGTDISRGVILNTQFGSLNRKEDQHITEKSIELNNTQAMPASETKRESKAEVPTDFKHMSGPRKVAFIFSFLPSIMFVLCFAVILPCEKKLPCIQEMWSLNLNDTTIRGRLQFSSEKLFYSYDEYGPNGTNGLISLDVQTGNQVWNSTVSYQPRLEGCGNLIENSSEACLVTGRQGTFELFNASSGDALLQLNVNSSDGSSRYYFNTVILPDCQGNGVSEYAFVTSRQEIKVVRQGYISSSISVDCDSDPETLTPWTTESNQTDLIFVCRKDEKAQIIRMPQSTWCNYKNEGSTETETSVFETGDEGSFYLVKFLPTPRGLIVWEQDQVTLFDVNGQKNWTVSSEPHYTFDRFLLLGKFNGSDSQIAMFSNNASFGQQMSLLDYETGMTLWNKTSQNTEFSDIVLMNGEKNDFVLVFQRKVERDLKAEAVSHLSEVPTTLISLLSDDAVVAEAEASKTTLVEEVIFMELGSNYYQSLDEKRVEYDEGYSYKGNVTVVHRPNNEIAIVILKRSELTLPFTLLRSISVSNWDISLTENRQCSWSA